MKKDIHPKNYRDVAFKDITSGKIFIIKSAISTDGKIEVDGKEYPMFVTDTSSASHPFYTGDKQSSKTAGMVDKFNKRFSKYQKQNS